MLKLNPSANTTSLERKKICYVLPVYDSNTATHLRHLYGFIENVCKEADVFLIIEKGRFQKGVFKECAEVKFQKFSFLPMRMLENLLLVFFARIIGYKNVYVHYSYAGAISGYIMALFVKTKVFYWNCGMPWLYKNSILREKIFRFILRKVRLVTGTPTLKEMYGKEYSLNLNNIYVMPNWIDIKEFTEQLKPKNIARDQLNISLDKKVILFVHHLSQRKGADILPTIGNAFRERKDILFVIVGNGPYKDTMVRDIRKNNLESIFRIEGAVANHQIPIYLAAADIFLMPSEEEGFPRVLLESMATGVPYVASSVGGVRDITPQELIRYIVNGKVARDYAQSIEALFRENKEVSAGLQGHVAKYDIKNVLPQFIGLF
jgi:glycosyltransferase involved in cell wall biosynthesis